MHRLIALVRPLGAAFLALLITAAPASAQTFTWDGGADPDNNWSNALNWGGNPLVSDINNTFLVMAGNVQTTTNLDIVGFNANSLTFDATAGTFVIGGGNTLTLGTGGITNLSANAQQISTPVALGAAQAWNNNGTGLLTINASVTGADLLTIGGTGNTTFASAGDFAGTAGLTKQGTGTLTLQGNKTYSGVTSIIAGEVVFTGTTSLGAIGAADNTVVASGATLTIGNNSINPTETLTLNGLGVGGVGALRKIGTTNSNQSGPITILSATRINSDTSGLFTISGAIGAGANSLTLGGTGNMTVSSVITMSGTLTKDGPGTLVLSGGNSASLTGPITITGGVLSYASNLSLGTAVGSGAVTVDGGTLRHTNPGSAGSIISANRTLSIGGSGGTVEYTTATSSNVTLYSGTITGTGVLTKIGNGELRYQGAGLPNTTFSKLVVNEGLYRLGFAASTADERGFGAVPAGFTADAITLNGGAIGTSFNIDLHVDRGITLGANGGVFVTAAGALGVPSVISGTGSLIKITGGTLNLNGTNTYTGGTTVTGTLAAASLADGGVSSAIGASTSAANNLVLNGGNLSYAGAAVSTDRLFSITSAGGTITSSGSGPITFTNTGAILATDKAAANFTLTSGSAVVSLAPGTNYADMVGLAVGMPVTGTGVPGGTTVLSINASGNVFNLSANATATGTQSLTFGSLNRTLTLTGTNTDANTISGVLANSPSTTLALTKAGAGTWVLTGANTYTGITTISGGILSTNLLANGGNASGIGSANSAAANLVLNGGTLQYTGAGVSTNRIFTLGTNGGTLDSSGSGALTMAGAQAIEFAGSGARTLTLSGSNTAANTLVPTLGDGTGGATSVVKSGAGTWVLPVGNSYTGGTTINGGTLRVTSQAPPASSTGSGAVAVNNTGTLEGTGSVGGAVNVASGGTLRAGTGGTGTLAVGNGVNVASGGNIFFRVTDASTPAAPGTGGSTTGTLPTPTSNNFINILGGTSSFDPLMNIIVDGTGTPFVVGQTYSYQIASGAGDQSSLNINDPARFTPIGFASLTDFSLTGNAGGAVFLNIAPVPEPATVLGLAAGALAMGGMIRRRKLRRA
jgi:fibronectin-binding autotransporter adhesin